MGKLLLECFEKKIKLRKIAKAVYKTLGQKAYLKAEIVFSEGDEMTELNRTTRGIDSITDVLSYPSLDGIKGEVLIPENCRTELEGKYIFLGSIVLCEEKIREQAKEYGHTEEKETEYLIVHGLMHLFGYDHMNETDKKEMRDKEKQTLNIIHEREIKAEKKRLLKEKIKQEKLLAKQQKSAETTVNLSETKQELPMPKADEQVVKPKLPKITVKFEEDQSKKEQVKESIKKKTTTKKTGESSQNKTTKPRSTSATKTTKTTATKAKDKPTPVKTVKRSEKAGK